MFFFVTFKTCSGLSFFLLHLAFLCHMSVLVAVEALRLSIFEVVIGLSNVCGLTLPSICCSNACLVIVVFFCEFIFLSD